MKVPAIETTNFDNTGEVVDALPEAGMEDEPKFHEPTESEKELVAFVVDHMDRWPIS